MIWIGMRDDMYDKECMDYIEALYEDLYEDVAEEMYEEGIGIGDGIGDGIEILDEGY